jgi:serine palmitoyltransferase
MDEASRALIHYAHRLTHLFDSTSTQLHRLPGSSMVLRYVRSSYQNDPVRSVIELALVLFCLVYVLSRRFSTDNRDRRAVELSEEEIEELVAEWTPEGLVGELDESEKREVERVERGMGVIVG